MQLSKSRIALTISAILMIVLMQSCNPQPAHAGDFIYSCKYGTTNCKVILNTTLNNEYLQAKANGIDYYWCNGWNTTQACLTTGTVKVLDGEFTTAELSAFDFSIKTNKDAGWVCYPKY